MTNPNLAGDYLERARKRLKAVALLFDEESWPDVVRESQEVVELALKAVLRSFGIPVPFTHDVSETFMQNVERLPEDARTSVPRWCEVSKRLRKDRELSFYGSEDLTPSRFYTRNDAEQAKTMAEEVVSTAAPWVRGPESGSGPGERGSSE